MKQNALTYLDIPEAFSGPWFREYLCVLTIVEPGNLLRVPFKMANKIGISEVIHYPAPEWAAPSLVGYLFALEFLNDIVALELKIGPL
jgi:hypothetical protein